MAEEETQQQNLKACPFCMEKVNAEAKKCRHCGETLDVVLRVAEEARRSAAAGAPIVVNNNNNNNNNNVGTAYPPKSRLVYILLGLFLGSFGIHNFYAGYSGRGIVQLLLTLFLGWLFFPLLIVWLWVLIEIIAVNRDARGTPFN